MPFHSPLDVRAVGKNKWELLVSLVYETMRGEYITVPCGFITDLASIPRMLRALIPVNGYHRAGAAVHDFLYKEGGYPLTGSEQSYQPLSRKRCDKIFLEAMKESGVSRWKRKAMYRAVRIGAGGVWKKYRQES